MARRLQFPEQKTGFTLVEVTIVLIISALIVAAVVSATRIIESARAIRLVTDSTRVNQAVLAFQARYGCIPGDCLAANLAAIPGAAECSSAEPDRIGGNGLIDGYFIGTNCESRTFGLHLQLAGLYLDVTPVMMPWVAGPDYLRSRAFPFTAFTPNSWYQLGIDPANWLVAEGGIWHVGVWLPGANQHTTPLSPSLAQSIDQRVDDGRPLTGGVRAVGYSNGPHQDDLCYAANSSFVGTCLGSYGISSGTACATTGDPADSAYVASDENTGAQSSGSGCKLAFRAPW